MNPVVVTLKYNTSQQVSYKLKLRVFKKEVVRLKTWLLKYSYHSEVSVRHVFFFFSLSTSELHLNWFYWLAWHILFLNKKYLTDVVFLSLYFFHRNCCLMKDSVKVKHFMPSWAPLQNTSKLSMCKERSHLFRSHHFLNAFLVICFLIRR